MDSDWTTLSKQVILVQNICTINCYLELLRWLATGGRVLAASVVKTRTWRLGFGPAYQICHPK